MFTPFIYLYLPSPPQPKNKFEYPLIFILTSLGSKVIPPKYVEYRGLLQK